MITVAMTILRSFLADRASVLLSLLAPIAFFTLVGAFYTHLDEPSGMRIQVAVHDASGSEDGRFLAAAIVRHAPEPIVATIGEGASIGPNRPSAIVTIPIGFSRNNAQVSIATQVPLPGAVGMLHQLVELAASTAFGRGPTAITINSVRNPNRLVREASVGISIVFMMFALSSLAAKGLADEAAGLSQRLASLGIRHVQRSVARVAAMTAIGLVQLLVTLAWAAVFFDSMPLAPVVLVLAGVSSAFAVAGFMEFVAIACGTRARFAAISPVVSLVLAAGSGALIPRFVMPERIAAVGSWLFPSWSIDSCRAAMDGRTDWLHVLGLLAAGGAATIGSAAIAARRRSA